MNDPFVLRQPDAAFVYSLEQSGICQLYSPDRAARIEWDLRLDEGRGFAAENPYVHVRRLLPKQTCQKSSGASDFHFHYVVHGFMTEASNRERFFAIRQDRKLDESRLWRDRHHRYCGLRRTRFYVLHQREEQAVGDVGREVKPLGNHFLFALILGVADLN